MLGAERPTLRAVTGHLLRRGAPRGSISAARLGLGMLAIWALTSGVLLGASEPADHASTASPGIERVVPVEEPTRTGLATVALNRPSAPVGDPERAIDAGHLIAVAAPTADAVDLLEETAEPADTTRSWFLVGDSTFTAAASHLGMGSSYPGVGFALAPFVGSTNPLTLPPAGFDGVIVIGVSIWDAPITDALAYVAAVDRYRSEGFPVLVVEVPERFGPGDEVVTTSAEEQELRALNRLVADGLDCTLAPWTVRDVETLGDVDGGDDHVHPTATGVEQLLEHLAGVADQICWPSRPPELR